MARYTGRDSGLFRRLGADLAGFTTKSAYRDSTRLGSTGPCGRDGYVRRLPTFAPRASLRTGRQVR
jgi:hypothetical protein